MITFKQFIAEIDHDDEHMTKRAANAAIERIKLNGYETLPKVSIPGYELLWKEDGPKSYRLALTKNGKAVIVMDLVKHSIRVPGGEITGVSSEGIYSSADYRGKGLALKMYEGLIAAGQPLFSSMYQTSGSRKIWETLAEQHQAFVVAPDAEARWYIRKHPDYEHTNAHTVLLTGAFDRLKDEAYASRDNRWLILPRTFANINTFREEAIELT